MRPQNWAVGASLSFPMHEISSIRARREIEAYRGRAEQARYRHVIQELTGRLEKARALLRSADRIAHDLPSRLETARAAERRAFAEYRNGLLSIADVTLAQRLLTQTEIDEVLARLNVWRARLGLAAAEGDLQPILAAGSRR
jgi:outer membrane protein TolC